MKVKHILIGFLLLSAVGMAWAGGTQEAAPDDTIELKYWFAARWKGVTGEEAGGQLGDWQRSVADRFMEMNPNVRIRTEHVGFADMLEKVIISVEAGNPPDVVEDGTARFFAYDTRTANIIWFPGPDQLFIPLST